jgi:FkbM family methyltransferase
MKNHINVTDRTYSFLELIWTSFKYLGFIGSYRTFYHYLRVRFIPFGNKKKYRMFGYTMHFKTRNSILSLLFEQFGLNIYFFKSDKAQPTIFDIGANIGDSVLYFKYLYPDAKIVAFEPHPEANKLLALNIAENQLSDVVVYNLALSDKEGVENLYSNDTEGTFDSSTFNKNLLINKFENGEVHQIKTIMPISIKEFESNSEIDLIKIDIEGAEEKVIASLGPILSRVKQVIIEYHLVPNVDDNSFDRIYTILSNYKFNVSVSGSYKNRYNVPDNSIFFINAYHV